MTDTINDARALAERLDYAMPLDVNPADVAHSIRAIIADLEAARAELARVTAERDAARSDLDDLLPSLDAHALMLTQVGRERDRAEAQLAAARAAMPTAEEYKRVADAFDGELMEAPKARREWLAAGAAWFTRLDAYHAAHPAASSDGTGRAGGGGHE